jgi:hypothetical protein
MDKITNSSQRQSSAQQNDSRMSDRIRFFMIFFMLGNVAWIFILSGSVGTWGNFSRLLGTCGLLSGASLITGALFGFIFGIPRSLTSAGVPVVAPQTPSNVQGASHTATSSGKNPADQRSEDQVSGNDSRNVDQKSEMSQPVLQQLSLSSRSTPTVSPNTNLEQISDWLTKVLVGIGLSQIQKMPDAFDGIESKLAPVLKPFEHGGVIGISICTAFVVAGFVWAYFESRTSLMTLFGDNV